MAPATFGLSRVAGETYQTSSMGNLAGDRLDLDDTSIWTGRSGGLGVG